MAIIGRKVLFGEAAGIDASGERLIGETHRAFGKLFKEAEDVMAAGDGENKLPDVVESVVEEPAVETDPTEDKNIVSESDEGEGTVEGTTIEAGATEVTEGVGPEVTPENAHEVADQVVEAIHGALGEAGVVGGENADVDTPIATGDAEAITDDSSDVDAAKTEVGDVSGDVEKVDAITVEVNV